MVHIAAAKFFECPELQLDEQESRAYAVAVAKVNAQYNADWNPTAMAWIQLLIVMGSIYGTRLYAIQARRSGASPVQPKIVDIKTPKGGAPDLEAARRRAAADAAAKAQTPADMFGLGYSAALAQEA